VTLSDRDIVLYAAIGFGVWLNGALTFYFTGGAIFESGPWIVALAAIFIAVAVCWIFRSTMRWRKTDERQAVAVAVTMGLPGLFGEAVRQLFFGAATGLQPQTQPVFAATLFFGNGALLAYALWKARAARA
jgi:hypothetical protein